MQHAVARVYRKEDGVRRQRQVPLARRRVGIRLLTKAFAEYHLLLIEIGVVVDEIDHNHAVVVRFDLYVELLPAKVVLDIRVQQHSLLAANVPQVVGQACQLAAHVVSAPWLRRVQAHTFQLFHAKVRIVFDDGIEDLLLAVDLVHSEKRGARHQAHAVVGQELNVVDGRVLKWLIEQDLH